MQLDAGHAVTQVARITAATAASSCIALSATPAYGLSLHEVASTVYHAPWGMFGVGCAVGAIVGGLVFGITGASARHRLYEELEDMSAEAQRARNSAEVYRTRYESLSEQRKREYVPTSVVQQQAQMRMAAQFQAQQQAQAQARAQAQAQARARAQAQAQAQAQPQQSQPRGATTATQASMHDSQAITGVLPRMSQNETRDTSRMQAQPQPVAQQPQPVVRQSQATNQMSAQAKPKGSVRDTLRHRLGSNAFDMPVIDRGQVVNRTVSMDERFPGLSHAQTGPMRAQTGAQTRAGSAPTHTSASQTAPMPRRSAASTITRSSIINKRVPTLDASLFPDTTQLTHSNADSFETALKAMDDTLGTSDVRSRASDHVDRLVQEELERNKRESARRYSRSRLTVIEGSSDTFAQRRTAAYRAQHLPSISREA